MRTTEPPIPWFVVLRGRPGRLSWTGHWLEKGESSALHTHVTVLLLEPFLAALVNYLHGDFEFVVEAEKRENGRAYMCERARVSDLARPSRIFHGWNAVAASLVMLFLNGSGGFMIGVMVKPVAAEFGRSRSAISAVIFLNLAAYALSIVISGRLYDLYDLKWLVASVLFALGHALMATMDSLWQLFPYYGVIAAVGMGGTAVPIFGSIVGRWFEKRRGSVISLAFLGNSLDQFLLVPLLSGLVVAAGWRSTSCWIAAASFLGQPNKASFSW
jgi:hypothetical protein